MYRSHSKEDLHIAHGNFLFPELKTNIPWVIIGTKLNLHITILLYVKYNCLYITGS